MKKLDEITKGKYGPILLISILSISFYFVLYNVQPLWKLLGTLLGMISPFIIGACTAFIVKIPMNFLENRVFFKIKSFKARRGLSLFLALVIILFCVFFLFVMVIPQLVASMQSLQQKLPIFLDTVFDYLGEVSVFQEYMVKAENSVSSFNWDLLFEKVKSFLFADTSKIFSNAMLTASSLVGKAVNLFVILAFAIYLLLDKEKLQRQTTRLTLAAFSEKTSSFIFKVFKLAHYYFYHFIKGQVTEAIILGLMVFVGMKVLKLPYAAMIAILTGSLGLIPIFGALTAGCIGFIFILIESPSQSIIFLIFILITQQIESNVIYPRVVGSSISLPAMWTLFAITIGGSIMGIIGMWIFLPIFAIIYTLSGEKITSTLKEKNIKVE